MGSSIGELFVKLGFDVDEKPLQQLNDTLSSVGNQFLKIAGVTATAAGFTLIAKNASDAALQVRNLGIDFDSSARAAQGFAAALHQFNPLVSTEQGLGSYKRLEQYIQNIRTNGGSAVAYNMLGGSLDNNTNPEVMINTVRANLPRIIAERGSSFASRWVNELFGDVGAMNALNHSLEEFQKAAEKGIVDQKSIDNMVKARSEIAELQNAWDGFIGHAVGTLAHAALMDIKEIKEKGFWGKVGDDIVATPSTAWKIFGHDLPAGIAYATGLSDFGESKEAATIANIRSGRAAYGAPGGAASGDTVARFMAMGWPEHIARGMARRLHDESGMNPNAVGDGGLAFGVAQWHPDRQRNFAEWAGHDIRGSSLEEQLGFVNYELTRGMERKAGNALRQTRTEGEAYKTFTGQYERPAVTQNNTINVYGSGNAEETAAAVDKKLQEKFSYTYQQQNLGAAY